MITVVFGDPNKPCDCPICRELGIDLTQIDGTDVREITPEQSQRLIDMGALRPIEELIDWAGDEDLGDWERTVN